MAADTIPARLLQQAETRPHSPAYHVRDNEVWVATDWRTYSEQVKRAGRALIALGFKPDDKLCILGFNRPEWVIADVAAMGCGGAPAGIYTTCSPEEVAYIVRHSEAEIVLVENKEQWQKLDQERKNMPKLRYIVTMQGAPAIDDESVLSWEDFMAKGDESSEQAYLDRIAALKPDALATLIYTSGTTGPPKGVMLSHNNLAWTAKTSCAVVGLKDEDAALSYLPLSHIAEQNFSIHAPITSGLQVYFAESIDRVPDNLKEIQPTLFFGVPRIWEKFYTGIGAKLKLASPLKKKLVSWAMRVGNAANAEPGGKRGLQYRLAQKLIFSKLKPAIGMGRARICVTGAAPISREILEFFASLDILVLEVYGQSEDTGPTSFNLPNRYRLGTVGPAFEGVEVRIAEDDEIMVSGPNVFMGYFKDPEATNAALTEGWLHSGDLGKFEDGFLHIIGRKKDIIITAGGKNITPKNIEAALKNHELINEAVVIGDRRKYLTALLTIDPDIGKQWAERHGCSNGDLSENQKLYSELQVHIDATNQRLARVEQIKKFKVLPRNLSVENGELTPTLKVKRNRVHERFASEIEAMYQSASVEG